VADGFIQAKFQTNILSSFKSVLRNAISSGTLP
jgi:hypothetical protein